LVEKDVIFGLQQGSAVLKEINKEMSLEAVEKLMDDTADAIAYQEVLTPPYMIVLICRKFRIYLLRRSRVRRKMRYWRNLNNCVARHWDYQRCHYIHYRKKTQELRWINQQYQRRNPSKRDRLYWHEKSRN
jgi:hypothetical protein